MKQALVFTVLMTAFVSHGSENNIRTRIICQAHTIPAVYMDPDQFEVRAPRLMVFDQNEPHESSFDELLRSRTTGIPFTLYAASRLHRIDLFEDGLSDEDIEEIAKDIVSAEKNNPFSIKRQSGKAPAIAEFPRLGGPHFDIFLDDGLKLIHHTSTHDGRLTTAAAKYVGEPPQGRKFQERTMRYRCFGPYEVPVEQKNDEDVYYGDEPPETSTRY